MHCAADPLGARLTACGSYTALLPLYFARTAEEQAACVTGLPADVGDETGDAVPLPRVHRGPRLPHKR